MADEPRKVGVYDTDGNRTAPAGSMNWWVIALVVLVILALLYYFL
ncbi:hypothetical protein [Azospirillum isscasi]|uniref:Uncharacterized protein n=1 Tax=Azospirillum isscasi TaxID=3053926 RepID=A0ABU0WG54_9PROT|nr:hypothetical protein [Azospirillum isscasi]MDQ2103184.1 hypothetical protein [Azospirillum isscasi]